MAEATRTVWGCVPLSSRAQDILRDSEFLLICAETIPTSMPACLVTLLPDELRTSVATTQGADPHKLVEGGFTSGNPVAGPHASKAPGGGAERWSGLAGLPGAAAGVVGPQLPGAVPAAVAAAPPLPAPLGASSAPAAPAMAASSRANIPSTIRLTLPARPPGADADASKRVKSEPGVEGRARGPQGAPAGPPTGVGGRASSAPAARAKPGQGQLQPPRPQPYPPAVAAQLHSLDATSTEDAPAQYDSDGEGEGGTEGDMKDNGPLVASPVVPAAVPIVRGTGGGVAAAHAQRVGSQGYGYGAMGGSLRACRPLQPHGSPAAKVVGAQRSLNDLARDRDGGAGRAGWGLGGGGAARTPPRPPAGAGRGGDAAAAGFFSPASSAGARGGHGPAAGGSRGLKSRAEGGVDGSGSKILPATAYAILRAAGAGTGGGDAGKPSKVRLCQVSVWGEGVRQGTPRIMTHQGACQTGHWLG